ncbi:hypothetical protein [Pseudophaeobacter sp.]|uniref:hypothetical protein n=1 Tax=Pseudophaeobacter sp. TaxID=1971739 RepID=UPI0032992CC8
MSISAGEIPNKGLLGKYALKDGCYTDCFYIDVPRTIHFVDFASAFFNSPIFRLERRVLAIFLSRPSSNREVDELASGASDRLALWKVEERDDTQMLLSVGDGPIRTWLMSQNSEAHSGTTRLFFGSAVLPLAHSSSGKPKIGWAFRASVGLHKLYSRILLWSASRNLSNRQGH